MKIDNLNSDGVRHAEKHALKSIQEAFNSSPFSRAWHGFANFEMIERELRDSEIDLILLTHARMLLIELKNWNGAITDMKDQWMVNGSKRGRSPVKVTSDKVRILKGRIERKLRGPARNVEIDYRVILWGSANALRVPDDERGRVSTLQEFLKIATQAAYEKYFYGRPYPFSPCAEIETFRSFFQGPDFCPRKFAFENFRIMSEAPLLRHRSGLYEEYKAVKSDDTHYQGLLRRWNFASSDFGVTSQERARVGLREHQVLGYIRDHDENLQLFVPQSIFSPTADDVDLDFCELYHLPRRQARLSEFVNRHGASLKPADKIAIVKVLLDHFADLHNIGVAHRDIGDHSVWLDLPAKISLSSFVTAYFPETVTVGNLRETLRAGDILLPEDMEGLGSGVPSDPFRRDTFLLGVVSHLILFSKWPARDSGIYAWNPIAESPYPEA